MEKSHNASPVKTRRSSSEHQQHTQVKDVCIFCDNPAGSVGLHNASTFEVDFKVRTNVHNSHGRTRKRVQKRCYTA